MRKIESLNGPQEPPERGNVSDNCGYIFGNRASKMYGAKMSIKIL